MNKLIREKLKLVDISFYSRNLAGSGMHYQMYVDTGVKEIIEQDRTRLRTDKNGLVRELRQFKATADSIFKRKFANFSARSMFLNKTISQRLSKLDAALIMITCTSPENCKKRMVSKLEIVVDLDNPKSIKTGNEWLTIHHSGCKFKTDRSKRQETNILKKIIRSRK